VGGTVRLPETRRPGLKGADGDIGAPKRATLWGKGSDGDKVGRGGRLAELVSQFGDLLIELPCSLASEFKDVFCSSPQRYRLLRVAGPHRICLPR
jgi:hypothetical protein